MQDSRLSWVLVCLDRTGFQLKVICYKPINRASSKGGGQAPTFCNELWSLLLTLATNTRSSSSNGRKAELALALVILISLCLCVSLSLSILPMSMTIWQCHPCLGPKRKDCEHDPERLLGSKPFPYPWQWARHDQPLQVRPCRFLNSKMQNPKSLLHLVMWLTWQAKEHTFCSKNTKKEGHSRVDQMIHIMLQILPLVQYIAISRFLHETCVHLSFLSFQGTTVRRELCRNLLGIYITL